MKINNRRRVSAVRIIMAAVAFAACLRLFGLDLMVVHGDSMLPSARTGSVALLARCAYGIPSLGSSSYLVRWSDPAPGDIVVMESMRRGGPRAIKRVFEMGPAYLTVEGRSLHGRGGSVSLSDRLLSHLRGGLYVPPGYVFVVGDNPGESYDSREYGSVPIEKVRGKVLLFLGTAEGDGPYGTSTLR